jgi:hypothetical protein
LAFLRTVDAVQSDAFGAGVVQDFDGITVEDADDLACEPPSDDTTWGKTQR